MVKKPSHLNWLYSRISAISSIVSPLNHGSKILKKLGKVSRHWHGTGADDSGQRLEPQQDVKVMTFHKHLCLDPTYKWETSWLLLSSFECVSWLAAFFFCRLRHDCEQRCWGWSSCLCSISTSRWSRWLGKILQSTSLHPGFSSTIWIGHWCCQKQSKLSQAWVPSCQHGTSQKSMWPSKSNSSMLLERAPLKRCNDLI